MCGVVTLVRERHEYVRHLDGASWDKEGLAVEPACD
jgi:hypothetical protein